MITPKPAWEAMTDQERFALLVRTELQRDNALFHARQLSGRGDQTRQALQVQRILDVGRDVDAIARECESRRYREGAL